jgi:type IV pilus assembly protein PilA
VAPLLHLVCRGNARLGSDLAPEAENPNVTERRSNMLRNRKGFTLIELLIVVVIIGILAAIAIPKFAATKDKAKLASVKTDVRNSETAEEAYFSDYATYGTFAQLQGASNFNLSSGNTMSITPVVSGYTTAASNASISSGITTCHVQVAAGAVSTVDGYIICP